MHLSDVAGSLWKVGLTNRGAVLAVASHPDDIALSCGGLVRCLSDVEITLLTCYTRSIYAPFAELKAVTVESVQTIRRLEDEEYARRIGAMRMALELDDVSLRYPNSQAWLCEKPVLDNTYWQLIEAIRQIVASRTYTMIMCPLAVGHHVDHFFVREAVRQATHGRHQILYYEDLPYGARIGGALAVYEHAQKAVMFGDSITIDITAVMNTKLEDIRVYKSQIYPVDMEGVVQYAMELGGPSGYAERIWVERTEAGS